MWRESQAGQYKFTSPHASVLTLAR